MLSSAGVAPLSPGFLKLLSDTLTTFAVFPSWMFLLGGDVNCMLPVPSGTCDLHISCSHGGDICQAIATAAFTLFIYALWSSAKYGRSPFCPVLLSCLRVTCSTFPVFWPDTASLRSCLSLPPGFLGTREAGICAGSRACFSLLSLLDFSVSVDLLQGHSGSHRANSRQAALKCEGFAIT